jgi:hypothetical protein
MAGKSDLSTDGLPLDIALPLRASQLNARQRAVLVKHFMWPSTITSNPRLLESNLDFRLQRHSQDRDTAERSKRLTDGLKFLVHTDPKQLIRWPASSIQAATGKMVMYDDKTGEVVSVADATPKQALAEDARRRSLEIYKAPPIKARVVVPKDDASPSPSSQYQRA